MASMTGGQTAVVTPQGERRNLRFRWMCLSACASIGSVWRCFIQTAGQRALTPWRAVNLDYILEADGRSLLKAKPGGLEITLGETEGGATLHHPEGTITGFCCRSGRVKITKLSSDGWEKRELLSLALWPDGNVIAHFSDGAQEAIGVALPSAIRARAA
jgi:hypothetical protein